MTQLRTLDDLRHLVVTHSLFAPTSLAEAIARLGFVQADPIRAPARAQDLTLRHRVSNYRAGELEARYAALGIEEDVFINYGFVYRDLYALMHPRIVTSASAALVERYAPTALEFVRERGSASPRELDAHFATGSTTNAWGGKSSLSSQVLDAMHYRGMLRIATRERGIRRYTLAKHPPGPNDQDVDSRLDLLIDVLLNKYAPLPQKSLAPLLARLRYATPQWRERIAPAIKRVRTRTMHAMIDGVSWIWPGSVRSANADLEQVRLLAPFDPVVWDRTRFELLWGWAYRFEAYTPAAKRKLGYYALPMLWRDQIIGWANVSVQNNRLEWQIGYVSGSAPKDRAFKVALEKEYQRFAEFLNLAGA